MSTDTNTTGFAHSTNADYRTWVSELSGMLTTVGFIKSADTGQVDTATATIPGTGSYNYEIRYLDDSLHATKPLYVKIEYGTQASGRPQIRMSAASGTNGSGTLTGTTYFSAQVLCTNAYPGVATYYSGAVALEGFAAFIWKRGLLGANSTFFAVARMCDAAGDPTTAGFNFWYSAPGGSLTRTSYLTSALSEGVGAGALFPGRESATLVGGSPQVLKHFAFTPEIQCVPYMMSFLDGEIGDLSTFTATPVGATQRTYLAFGGSYGPQHAALGNASSYSTARLAIQWE